MDSLGVDKGYTMKNGLLHTNPSSAASKLREYISVKERDDRLAHMQTEFDQCAAQRFGWELDIFDGLSREGRLNADIQSKPD